MCMYYETMTDAFVLPFAATTPTTPPVKGKCLGPMYFKIQSCKRAFWAPGFIVAKQLERWTCNSDLRIEARFQVPSWPLDGVVLGSPQLKSLVTLVNGSDRLLPLGALNLVQVFRLQSNLFNTDTKGTEPSVRFTEVSVL